MLISELGNKGISITIVLIIIALVIDSSIVSIVTSTGGLSSSAIGLFVFMIGVFAVGQYVILGFIKYNYIKKQKIGVISSDLSFLLKTLLKEIRTCEILGNCKYSTCLFLEPISTFILVHIL